MSPAWSAARNGLNGDSNAVNASAKIDQHLVAHPSGWASRLFAAMFDQANHGSDPPNPVTLNWTPLTGGTKLAQILISGSGSASTFPLGIVAITGLRPVGRGADLKITAVLDDGTGNPGTTPLATAWVPRDWINALASTDGAMSGPLMLPQNHVLVVSVPGPAVPWASATGTATLASAPFTITGGNYMILIGGTDASGAATATVTTIGYAGAGRLTLPNPATPLPSARFNVAACATNDTLIVAGGVSAGSVTQATVWTASWSPDTGEIGQWTAQPNMPAAVSNSACVFDPTTSTVYVIGGTFAGVTQPAIYYATLSGGQLGAWHTANLPTALQWPHCAVSHGWLVAAGGTPDGTAVTADVRMAPINADGSLGAWVKSPSPLNGGSWGAANVSIDHGLVMASSSADGNQISLQTVTFGATGAGIPYVHQVNGSWYGQYGGPWPTDTGEWDFFAVKSSTADPGYDAMKLTWVPFLGGEFDQAFTLAAGSTSYLVVEQVGGTAADYLEIAVETSTAASLNGTWTLAAGVWSHDPNSILIGAIGFDESGGSVATDCVSDSGARITQLLYSSAGPTRRVLGVLEATKQPDGTWLSSAAAIDYDSTNTLPIGATTIDPSSTA